MTEVAAEANEAESISAAVLKQIDESLLGSQITEGHVSCGQ
jgi:hypothetical protein